MGIQQRTDTCLVDCRIQVQAYRLEKRILWAVGIVVT